MSVGLLKDMLRTRSDECAVSTCHKRRVILTIYEGESEISKLVDNANRKMCEMHIKEHRKQLQVACRALPTSVSIFSFIFVLVSCFLTATKFIFHNFRCRGKKRNKPFTLFI